MHRSTRIGTPTDPPVTRPLSVREIHRLLFLLERLMKIPVTALDSISELGDLLVANTS